MFQPSQQLGRLLHSALALQLEPENQDHDQDLHDDREDNVEDGAWLEIGSRGGGIHPHRDDAAHVDHDGHGGDGSGSTSIACGVVWQPRQQTGCVGEGAGHEKADPSIADAESAAPVQLDTKFRVRRRSSHGICISWKRML
jgi:hypothetical protein